MSRNKRLFLQKTDEWREGRRLIHQLTLGAESKAHGQLIESASLRLLEAYLDEPGMWYAHNYRFPVSIMHELITNTPLRKSTAKLVELQAVTSTFLTSINSHVVDFFPVLARLPKPLQWWRAHWEGIGDFHYKVFKAWWSDMTALTGPSWARNTVLEGFSGDEDQAMYIAMLAMSAGADNPRMTLNACVMACLAYPAAVQEARAEIQGLCGAKAERLPELGDLPNLPYVCAFVKEILRWRPTVPLIPQRVLVRDLDFEGYRFPAGTEFLVNSVPVCSNGYDEPHEFRPRRWLLHEQKSRVGIEQDLWHFAFSGGKRSCAGYKLAQKEMFVACARLLYCFDMSPAGEFDSRQLNAFRPGEPFPVRVAVRSLAHEDLIRREALIRREDADCASIESSHARASGASRSLGKALTDETR